MYEACGQVVENMRSSRLKSVSAFLIVAGLICAVGYGFDRLLLQEGVPRFDVLLLANLLTGLVAAALFVQVRVRAEEKERLLEQKLETIAEMNHHVRNALQVLAFYGIKGDDKQAGDLINQSIARIEWTLKEVLPRGWDVRRQAEESELTRDLSDNHPDSKITA